MKDNITPEKVEWETQRFLKNIVPYGSSDINTAIETFMEVGLDGDELAEMVEQQAEELGTPLKDMDVCYVAYDHILQMARNKIDEVLKFDIVNDIEGGTEFYTYGNYMCTSFDYSTEAHDQLEEKISRASQDELDELAEDDFVKFFLSAVDIDLPEKATEEALEN